MTDQATEIKRLKLVKIISDPEIQPREKIHAGTVDEYAAAIMRGEKLPPLVVFRVDGQNLLLVDGFHRIEAAFKAKRRFIEAEIHEGSREDAIDFANGANAKSGRRLTNADKRRVADRMLRDKKWRKKSDKAIARHAGVTDRFVAKRRTALTANSSPSTREVVRNGKEIEMDISNIGNKGRGKKGEGPESGAAAQMRSTEDQDAPAEEKPTPAASDTDAAAPDHAGPQQQAKQTPPQDDQDAPADERSPSTTPIEVQPNQPETPPKAATSQAADDVAATEPVGEPVQTTTRQDIDTAAKPDLAILRLSSPVTNSTLLETAKAEILGDAGAPGFHRLLILPDDGESNCFDVLNSTAGALRKSGFPLAFRIQVMGGDHDGMWAAIATTDTDETNPVDALQRLIGAVLGSAKEIRVGGS